MDKNDIRELLGELWRKSYHEKVCLVRKFQNVWIPFPSCPAWKKSMQMHALKAE